LILWRDYVERSTWHISHATANREFRLRYVKLSPEIRSDAMYPGLRYGLTSRENNRSRLRCGADMEQVKGEQ